MMPSAVNHTPSPDLFSGTQSEAMKQVLQVIEKKVRNMEKKKCKLNYYQAKKNKGEFLNQDQLEALTKFQEVSNRLHFAQELQKSFLCLGQEIQKADRMSTRGEQLHWVEEEQRRLKTVLERQFLLDQLGDEQTKQDLKQPSGGYSLLSNADLTALDNFYKLVSPERDHGIRLTDQYEEASLHFWELLEGRDMAVAGTTYKALKGTLDKILLSGYFDKAKTHQNRVCEDQDVEQAQPSVAAESSESGEQNAVSGETLTENITEIIEGQSAEFVNRQFILGTTYSSSGNDRIKERAAETRVVIGLQHQLPPYLSPEPHPLNPSTPSLMPNLLVRKQVEQQLIAQMQGTYNFMRDCMLEFDGHSMDPAIVSAQPMKPAQNMDLQQMVHSESRLLHPSTVPESTLVFSLTAPQPPSNEAESLKQNQFPSSFVQGFGCQAEPCIEQLDIQQDSLQSGGFRTQDQVMSLSGGHQVHSSQGPSCGHQSIYNNGGPRNARGMSNGYRGSSNGFRGYDGCHPPFNNTPIVMDNRHNSAQYPRTTSTPTNGCCHEFAVGQDLSELPVVSTRGLSAGVQTGSSPGSGGAFKPNQGMLTQMAVQQANYP